jgi:hypothetical protein
MIVEADDKLIVLPSTGVHVVGNRTTLGGEITLEVPVGLTISEIMARAGMDPRLAKWIRVETDGKDVPPHLWDRVRPKAGRVVSVNVIPTGGGGGDSNKTLRTVLLIVVVILAAVVTYYTAGAGYPLLGAALGALTMAAGDLTLDALQPPPVPGAGNCFRSETIPSPVAA